MSITDGLRRYAANWDGFFYDDEDGRLINAIGYVPARSTPVPNVINAIADSIDKQHAKECDKAYNEGVNDGIDADKNAMGYVKLPVDADGVPIHVGDAIEIEHNGRVTTVTNINYNEYGWQVYCAEGGGFDKDTRCHHVQPDSWERIIQDARESSGFRTIGGELPKYTDAELVERCRRLADA